MLQKQPQQLVFLIGQLHARTVRGDNVLVGVQADTAALQQGRRLLRLAAAQHRLDAGDQLHDAEGLDEIVVCAEIQPLNLVIFCALRRRHDDGDGRKGGRRLHAPQKLDAVEPRQHHVENDKLGRFFLKRVPEDLPVFKALCLEAGGLQCVYLNVADAGIVLHTPDHVGILLSCYFGFVYAGDGKLHPFGDIRGVISYTLIILCDHQ